MMVRFGADPRSNCRAVSASVLLVGVRAVAAGCVWLPALSVWAQEAGGARPTVSIVPRISVSETYTTNALLSNANQRSDLITQISPGIRISSNGGRIRGSLDYALTQQLYANNSSRHRSQNALTAAGTVEAIDNWAFVDFSGSIGQQAISAFGAPAGDGSAVNSNSTETAVFRLSPYVRGRFGSAAEYEARYSLSTSRSGAVARSDVNSSDLALRLNGTGGRQGLGWSLTGDHQTIDYSAGRSTSSRRLNGYLSYPINDKWGVYVKAGTESSDFLVANNQNQNFTAVGVNFTPNDEAQFSIDRDSRGSTGLVLKWAPSRRTSVSVTRERRLFGDTQTIALAYRTANTAWTFSQSKGAVTNTGLSVGAPTQSLYDTLLAQFSAGETDPVRREQFGAFLIANGIRPANTAIGGFLTSALSLQNHQQLSFALFGARNTISVIATRSSNTRLDTASVSVDDLSRSGVVRQNGVVVNLSHRFTPASVLNLAASSQNASGSAGQAGTSTKSVNVNLSTRLTKDTTASIGARRVIFDSSTAPYNETAVVGNVNVQF